MRIRRPRKRRQVAAIVRSFEEQRQCLRCGRSLAFEPINKVYCSGACRQAEYRERRYDSLRDRRRNRNAAERVSFGGEPVSDKHFEAAAAGLLAEDILAYDRDHPGDDDAEVIVDADVWKEWVGYANAAQAFQKKKRKES
jgi:hypothetical protein